MLLYVLQDADFSKGLNRDDIPRANSGAIYKDEVFGLATGFDTPFTITDYNSVYGVIANSQLYSIPLPLFHTQSACSSLHKH
jgi:hypothetical protein